MKVTFIIKKAAKRYDTESTATIYIRLRNGRLLDSVAPTQLSINPNLWDDKAECVKTKAVCNEDLRTGINEEIRKLKTYVEKSFHTEKESVDKEWLKLTLDRYYHPEKYFTPEEIAIKPTFGELFDSFLEKHPLSEVRKKNFRVVKEPYCVMNCMYGKPKEGKKALFLMLIPSHLKRFGTCGTSSRTNTNIMNCTRAFMKPFQKRELRNHVEKTL